MFSKDILKQDLNTLETLKHQRDNCRKLIISSIRDIISTDNLTYAIISDETSTLQAIHAQLQDLEEQIALLEEQMFLNYANTWQNNTRKTINTPGTSFPHLDTIIS